jgi:hypothetical protein
MLRGVLLLCVLTPLPAVAQAGLESQLIFPLVYWKIH